MKTSKKGLTNNQPPAVIILHFGLFRSSEYLLVSLLGALFLLTVALNVAEVVFHLLVRYLLVALHAVSGENEEKHTTCIVST